tara:strand:- start:1320 stop:1442 length:123 start_codon:yes stop_codon:yes gene_type:complete
MNEIQSMFTNAINTDRIDAMSLEELEQIAKIFGIGEEDDE